MIKSMAGIWFCLPRPLYTYRITHAPYNAGHWATDSKLFCPMTR